MTSALVDLRLPSGLYSEIQSLADEEQTDPVTIIARLVEAAREHRVWRKDLATLRQRIVEEGGLHAGNTKDQVVEQLRDIRREIFEAEYAHLYR